MHAWEIRKYDKVLENMFFIAFSKTQPNSRKYFAKYFQEHIQTFENNLLSKKYSSPENILWKIFPVKLNTKISPIIWPKWPNTTIFGNF